MLGRHARSRQQSGPPPPSFNWADPKMARRNLREICAAQRDGTRTNSSAFKHQTQNNTLQGKRPTFRLQDCALSAPAWLRDAEDPVGSPREHSAQYATASEEGNEVPRLTRSGMETNTETAVVISSTATAQADLSMGCTPGRAGDGAETGTGKMPTSKYSSELIQRRREGVSTCTCTVLWTQG